MANTIAYGFIGLEHIFAQRVDDSTIPTVQDAIAQSVTEHNRQVQSLLGDLVRPTTEAQTRFYQPGGGTLQPLDEWGNPLPVRPAGFYDLGFPIQGGGTAWGTNRVSRALMTVEEASRNTFLMLQQDADWMKRHILAALFDDTSWTFDDKDKGNLTIQPLANGDSVTYTKRDGQSATDDHYLAQASAIDDSNNPFDDIYSELREHPGNDGPIVAYIPTNQVAAVEALTAFTEVGDPDVDEGADTATLSGRLDRGFGTEVLGKANKVWIVEWSNLPDDYIIAHARGAQALAMRQYPAGELQGLFTEEDPGDGNSLATRYIRYAGFGALNRTAALAYRIGNASYAVPTGYDAPLAI